MAQSKVTNFFAARKRNGGIQPSKRLKVQREVSIESVTEAVPETKSSIPSVERLTSKTLLQPNLNVAETTTKPSTRGTRAKSVQKSTSRSTQQQPAQAKAQPGIQASLRVTRSSSRSSSPVNELPVQNETKPESKIEIGEFATAACDDHTVSPPTTPTKRTTSTKGVAGGKRSKHAKSVRKDLLADIQPEKTSDQGYDFSKFIQKPSEELADLNEKVARKRLVMKRRNDDADEKKTETEDETKEQVPAPIKSIKENLTSKQKTSSKPKASSKTPAETKKTAKFETLDPAAVRAKLAKSGKLAELQERLASFSTAAAKVKEERQIQKLAELKSVKEKANEAAKTKPTKAPAFARFKSLAEPVPETLNLPFKYKLLLDLYHGVDTVVSMLHNRTEVCTFNKLKKAVQIMTRKNFEEKHLAQIKTVFPEGFKIRQEKGIAIPGTGMISSWQLTIEANLENTDTGKEMQRDKDGRPLFSGNVLLERKSLFHRLLIEIVKTHHKDFLSGLDRPLTVADDKVTRWHPRFKVDQVADIDPANLPQPPDVKKFTTASQVLDEARTKNSALNARVQKALENVAKQKKAQEEKVAAKKASGEPGKKSTEKKPATDIKGVPQSLLERIRAKEAETQVRQMMLTPSEEKRKEMISRLPDIVRILRTYFVTYKKPCLPMEEGIKKVADSARSSMGTVEAETHIKLLIELVPDWVQVITVRKGSYLKIDRNQETSSVINKINTFLKT